MAWQAGLARAVSHHQLSLPRWDCCSHSPSRRAPQSLWAAPGKRQARKNLLPSPRAASAAHRQLLAMPGALPHLQQARSGVGQAAVGPHPLCRHLMSPTVLIAGAWGYRVPLAQALLPCCAYPGTVYTPVPYGNSRWHHERRMEKDGEAAVFAAGGHCWLGAVDLCAGWHQAAAASTPVTPRRCPHAPPGAPQHLSSRPGTLL